MLSDFPFQSSCLHPVSVSPITRPHSLFKRRITLFPNQDQTDVGSFALHTFYQQLKQFCQLDSSTANNFLLAACGGTALSDDTPTINTHRLQALIEGGGYESIQYQLYLTEMRRISADIPTNHLVINGLYQLTRSLTRSNQGVVYGNESIETIDVRQAVKLHTTERSILIRFWSQPNRSEETGIFDAIGSSFVEYIYTVFGSKGVKELVSVAAQSLDNPEDFVFRGHTMSELECKWREYVEMSVSCHSRMSILQFVACLFAHYVKQHAIHVIFMLLLSCADVAASLGTSLLIGRLFDVVVESNRSTLALINPAYQLVIVWCSQMAIALIHVMLSVRLAVHVSCKLREQLFSRMHRVRPQFFLDNSSASIISCFSNDIESIEIAIAITFTLCLQAVLLVVTSLGFLLLIEWRLTLGLIVVVLLFQIVINVMARKASDYQFNKGECLSRLLSMMKDNIDGYRVNAVYHLESYWNRAFCKLVETKYVNQVVRGFRFTLSLQMISMLHPQITAIFYLIAAALLIKLDLFTYSEMLVMYTVAAFTASGVTVLGRSISQLTRAAAGMARVQTLLDDRSAHGYKESTNSTNRRIIKTLEVKGWSDNPTVELRNVSFCYETHSTLWNVYNVSLKIPFGQSVALVGGSGAGKSTILSLIVNMYSPTEGDVLIDGQNVQNICPEDLPFGVTLQQNYLFNMTVGENIRLGRLDASGRDIENAAKAAAIHRFIMQLPLQYDTLIGEEGVALSGGQQQRIAIARMLVRRPKILLLDDVTSALDALSEQRVFATIRKLFHCHTVIYVTHKLSLAQPAECIVFMSHGKVKEIGNHCDLMEKQGAYYHLWNEQQHMQNHSTHVKGFERDGNTAEKSHMSSSMLTSSTGLSGSGNPLRHTGSVDDIGTPQIIEFLIDHSEANDPYLPSSEVRESCRPSWRTSLPFDFLRCNKTSQSLDLSNPHSVGCSNHQDTIQRTGSESAVGVTLSHMQSDQYSSTMATEEKDSTLDCQQHNEHASEASDVSE